MNLSDKQLQTITEIITPLITEKVIEKYEALKKEESKNKYDRRLRNIKLLLSNYRHFQKHVENVESELSLLNYRLDLKELDKDDFTVKAFIGSKEKTLAMIHFIDQTLESYRVLTRNDIRPEAKRTYEIIYSKYLQKEKVSIETICDCHNIDKRTMYRDINKACETLVLLMFGVDGLKISS